MPRLIEGDIIKIEEGDHVYADGIPMHFLYTNYKGDFTPGHGEIIVKGELLYIAGEYVVTHASMDGGGEGHGPGDSYPDGWHVHCERLGPPHNKLDFYQSGCFTAMMPKKKSIGRATRSWRKA